MQQVVTQRLNARRVRHLKAEDLWIQEKVRSHELRIPRVTSGDNRADFLTKFPDPERHHKLIKHLSTECAGNKARVGKLSGAGSGVVAVASQSYNRQSA